MMQVTRAHGGKGIFSFEEPNLRGIRNLQVVNSTPTPGKVFSQLKVLLVPSLWEEPFCRTILEAMSNGIPVVTSNRGGISEALQFGDNAHVLIKDVKNIDEWSNAIELLFSDKALYEELSIKAKHVINNFHTDRNIDNFVSELTKSASLR